MTPEINQILEASRVPNTKVFFLGCFEKRLTVLSQQRRAINLVDAILESGLIRRPNGRVAIVGAGASGLTAAAAFLVGAPDLKEVALFEKSDKLLHLQQGSDRYLHPHLYDWPAVGSLDFDARLPILNWAAGTAGEVASQILTQFEDEDGGQRS